MSPEQCDAQADKDWKLPKMHTLHGRRFSVMAEFHDTEQGRRQANAFMENNFDAAVLEVTNGTVILADRGDKGVSA